MPIFPRRRDRRHSDGKFAARLISEQVVRSIDNPSEASEISLMGAYRLLDNYRYNTLERGETRGLHKIMERTRMEVFPRTEKRKAADTMMKVIGNLAYPEKCEKPDRRYFQKTRAYFDKLREEVSH